MVYAAALGGAHSHLAGQSNMPTTPVTVPFYWPANRAARQACIRHLESNPATELEHEIRNVCLVAISSVGRAKWAQETRKLRSARAGALDFNDGVNCWSWVVKWAIVAGALSPSKAERFLIRTGIGSDNATAVDSIQSGMKRVIYDEVARTSWAATSTVPVGAMVYHGRRESASENPIAHVTLHVGENQIVGTWGAAYLASPDVRREFELLLAPNRGGAWIADTLITDIKAFGTNESGTTLEFSNAPFWTLLNLP